MSRLLYHIIIVINDPSLRAGHAWRGGVLQAGSAADLPRRYAALSCSLALHNFHNFHKIYNIISEAQLLGYSAIKPSRTASYPDLQ